MSNTNKWNEIPVNTFGKLKNSKTQKESLKITTFNDIPHEYYIFNLVCDDEYIDFTMMSTFYHGLLIYF